MASHEKHSFVHELRNMCEALEQAGKLASSLKELHEAEVRSAVREVKVKMKELKRRLHASQEIIGLPQQIMEVKHEAAFSPCSSLSCLTVQGRCMEEDCDVPLVESTLRESGRSADVSRQAWTKADTYLQLVEDTPDTAQSSDDLPKSDVGPAASEASTVSDVVSPAITTFKTDAHRNPIKAFTGEVREMWAEAKKETLAEVNSRCSVHIVHLQDRRAGKPLLGSWHSLDNLKLPSTSAEIAKKAARCCTACRVFFCGIMNPVGPVRFLWNAMCLFFIAYDLFAVPMMVFRIEDVKSLQVFEWILTIWWTVDVYMTFRTGYIIGSRVEMRPKRIAVHYATTWLLVDIVIVIMEWVNRLAVAYGSASLLRTSRALRMLRYLKLFRASKIHSFFKALQDQVNSNVMHLCITMALLGGVLLLTIHITCCVWYALGDSRDDGWITYDLYEGEKNNLFWYIASFRWVVSQFNGRTDMDERRNLQERLFTCFVGVALAVILQAVFISFITKTMLDLSELVSEKTRRQRVVNAYLEINPLPPLLISQVKRCLRDYQDIEKEIQKEDEVLALLPNHLQTDVLEEVRSPVLMQHPLFRALPCESPWVMRLVCWKVVQTVSASKDEVVFDRGDICERILFTDKLTATYGNPVDPNIYRADEHDHEVMRHARSSPSVSPSKKSKSFFRHRDSFQYGTDLLEFGDSRTIAMGSWISEAALWVEWRNQGRLLSNGHGVLLAVSASKLAFELRKFPDAFALAYLHANTLATELRSRDYDEISDILDFEVELHAPLRATINVVSAMDLRNADCFLTGKSDPYCVCSTVGLTGRSHEIRFKTKTIDNTLDPVWNHSAELGLSWYQLLEFQVWDYDFGKRDTVLGVASISPEEFALHGFEGNLPLRDPNGGPGQGCVKVKIQVMDAEEPALLNLWSPKKKLAGKTRSSFFSE